MNTTTAYPRSLPFQPPQTAPSPKPRLSRRQQIIAAATGAVLLVAVVAGIVYASNRSPAPAPSTDKPADNTAKVSNERMLETLGGLSAAHLYQTYLNIGLVADAVENETYTQAQASEMLANVAGLMDVVDKQLERLAKMDLSKEDKVEVQRIRSISSLMRVQVASLQAYWLTNDPKHAARYHETREQAWAGLSEVLGL